MTLVGRVPGARTWQQKKTGPLRLSWWVMVDVHAHPRERAKCKCGHSASARVCVCVCVRARVREGLQSVQDVRAASPVSSSVGEVREALQSASGSSCEGGRTVRVGVGGLGKSRLSGDMMGLRVSFRTKWKAIEGCNVF